MMAPDRYPNREHIPRERVANAAPAPVYAERMARRRQEVERAQRRRTAARNLSWMVCALLAACLMVLCGMRIYQSARAVECSRQIAQLREEIHELTLDVEASECAIAEAASRQNIELGANRLGMTWPGQDQVRAVNPN